ncbi:MAG: GtrA family protein [Candidatus Melainabacteria bacterium]|jgi:putative flippase GtrA|nr:GtrA family protein [Candidatus Melainabacteria bacterium]
MSLSEQSTFQQPAQPFKTLWFRLQRLAPQLRGFVLAGLIGTLIDYGFYQLYDQWLPPLLSKGLAFSSATLFVYFMNKFWTFKQPLHSRREISAFFALYTVSMVVNTAVNSLCLQGLPSVHQYLMVHSTNELTNWLLPLFSHARSVKLMAFLMATGTSTMINFMGQKFWVFELKKKQLAKQEQANTH